MSGGSQSIAVTGAGSGKEHEALPVSLVAQALGARVVAHADDAGDDVVVHVVTSGSDIDSIVSMLRAATNQRLVIAWLLPESSVVKLIEAGHRVFVGIPSQEEFAEAVEVIIRLGSLARGAASLSGHHVAVALERLERVLSRL